MKCRFCYYIDDVTARNRDKDLSTASAKELIVAHYRRKLKVIEFTGGEPTIRKDLFELVTFAREIGFSKVSIITNGLRLADQSYAKKLVDCGVSDFLFSLHGSTAAMHDFVTRVNGSYDLLLKAIQNLISLEVRVRCNSVITGSNLKDIYARAKLFCGLNVKTVNFIMFNPIEQAKSSGEDNFFRYSSAAEHLKNVVDDFSAFFKKLTIRYMPLCQMKGYEQYIQNVHQVHFDHDEWDYYYRSYVREPCWKWLGGLFTGLMLLPAKRMWLKRGMTQALHAAILEAHSFLHKHKFTVCRKCSYGFICGGVWKEYALRFGPDEFRNVPGSLILDPWYFMNESQRAID